LWDDHFVGWPDYSDHPLKRKDIESAIAEEFQSVQTPGPTVPAPIPEEIEVLGDVAVTYYYFRPEANETSPVKYRGSCPRGRKVHRAGTSSAAWIARCRDSGRTKDTIAVDSLLHLMGDYGGAWVVANNIATKESAKPVAATKI
jgi:hypothetical protein